MITLKQIVYALAIEKTLHFKQAAEQCSVSQSALSTAITEMEKQLGFQIFERNNKKVLVTPVGKQALERAHKIKLQMDDLQQLGQSLTAPLSHPMSLGIIPTISPYLLPTALPRVHAEYPDFRLRIVEEQSHVLVKQVQSGDLDAAILALPFNIEGLLSFEFMQEDFYWITHKDEPLAKRKEISSNDIPNNHLMLLKEGHCLKDHALAACQLTSSQTDSTLVSNSLNTLVQMAAGKMGTTLAPEMALKQLLAENSELKAIHLNEPGPHRKIAFITRPNYPSINNIERLMEIFRGS